MHCLLWCWGRTGRPGRRFIPITPVKGKKRIRRSSGYRVAGACPQVGPLPFKAPPALPIYNGEQDAPLPYRIVCMAGHPRCLLPNFFWPLYGRDFGLLCVRASGFGPGLVFSDRSGDLSDPGLWARGLVRSVSGSSRVSGSGFAMSVCGFDGVERWRALLWRSLYRQRLPGLSGPAARSTQEHCCFCERDDFASTCSRRGSTSGQLQKTVLNPVDSGRARA